MDTVAYYSLKNLSVKSWLRELMDYGKLSVLMTPWAREMYQGKINILKFDLFENFTCMWNEFCRPVDLMALFI